MQKKLINKVSENVFSHITVVLCDNSLQNKNGFKTMYSKVLLNVKSSISFFKFMQWMRSQVDFYRLSKLDRCTCIREMETLPVLHRWRGISVFFHLALFTVTASRSLIYQSNAHCSHGVMSNSKQQFGSFCLLIKYCNTFNKLCVCKIIFSRISVIYYIYNTSSYNVSKDLVAKVYICLSVFTYITYIS